MGISKHIIIGLTGLLFLVGCAGRGPVLEASETLYSTDKSTTKLFEDVKSILEKNRYRIRKMDPGTGIMVTQPRRFSFDYNGRKTYARQLMHLRQEGASVKIRLTYDCNYSGDELSYEPCRRNDESVLSKISRVEGLLLKKIAPALRKFADQETQEENLTEDQAPTE